jgi:hypothetical protein
MEKAQRERSVFEKFLELSAKSFDRFESAKPPEPDIIAWSDGKEFGIEITGVHRQHERSREGEEDKITALACEFYERGEGPFLNVSIMWAFNHGVARRDRDLAREIANLIRDHAPAPKSWAILEWDSLGDELMSAVNHISIDRLVNYTRNYWHAARGGCVPSWEQENLQLVMDRKRTKPANYRSGYFETWLLLVSGFGEPSSWFEMTDSAEHATYHSTFKRVFLLSSFPHKVFELRIEA